MKPVTITVGGHSFQIRSDAGPLHLEGLAEEIDRRYKTIERRGPRAEQEFRALAMVAIVLLDELQRAEQRGVRIAKEARAFASRLLERIDAVLDPRNS
ncbi:MAG TPA: cell division protein ZapA [Phycisphaerae bacterium]|nr:cell division protein ZapA [Phycisphaerae bacterium]